MYFGIKDFVVCESLSIINNQPFTILQCESVDSVQLIDADFYNPDLLFPICLLIPLAFTYSKALVLLFPNLPKDKHLRHRLPNSLR